MHCLQCQFENSDTAKFWKEFGDKLARTCPGCAHEVRPSAKFSPECGTSLTVSTLASTSTQSQQPATQSKRAPASYTPQHLAEKIFTSRRDLDPEAVQNHHDLAIHSMMDTVHRFEGTVNQVFGEAVTAQIGALISYKDHAARACYSAFIHADSCATLSLAVTLISQRQHSKGRERDVQLPSYL